MSQAIAVDRVEYVSSAIKCPDCKQFRPALLIFEDGALRCDGCPAYERRRRPSNRKRTTPC